MIKDTAETGRVHSRVCIEEHSPREDTQAEISVMTITSHIRDIREESIPR